ncbi:hypothetical protein NQ318_006506, partial [Aromia moschata]
ILRSPSHESVTTDLSLFSVSSAASDVHAGRRLLNFGKCDNNNQLARGYSPNPENRNQNRGVEQELVNKPSVGRCGVVSLQFTQHFGPVLYHNLQIIMNKYEDQRLSRKQLEDIIDNLTDYESGAETEQEAAEPDNASEISEHESLASEIDSSDFEFKEQIDKRKSFVGLHKKTLKDVNMFQKMSNGTRR